MKITLDESWCHLNSLMWNVDHSWCPVCSLQCKLKSSPERRAVLVPV